MTIYMRRNTLPYCVPYGLSVGGDVEGRAAYCEWIGVDISRFKCVQTGG